MMDHITTTRWAQSPSSHRIRHLCRRYGLSEPAARLLAPFIYGETAQ